MRLQLKTEKHIIKGGREKSREGRKEGKSTYMKCETYALPFPAMLSLLVFSLIYQIVNFFSANKYLVLVWNIR